MQSSLFFHVVLLAGAGALVFMQIMPTFAEIKQNEDTAAMYKREIQLVQTVNMDLANKVAQINALNLQQQATLATYMSEDLDTVALMRDVETITLLADLEITELSVDTAAPNVVSAAVSTDSGVLSHAVSLGVTGTYEQIQNLFNLIHQNNYPMFIDNLEVALDQENVSVFTVTLQLVAYSLAPTSGGEVITSDVYDEEVM
jgi:hypothetical protein